MKNEIVSVIYDRKKTAATRGVAKIEARIYLSRTSRKYITLGNATPIEWAQMEAEDHFSKTKKRFADILTAMSVLGEELSIENFNRYAGIETVPAKPKNLYGTTDQDTDFLEWLEKTMRAEDLRIGTLKHKLCVLEAIRRFGKIKKLCDLTPANLMEFDRWLHDGTRTDVTIYGYHKNIKCYCRQLRMADMIPVNPYDKVKFKRGKSKERQPLTEEELKKIRDAKFDTKLDRVRDLFIFAAYTGLSYVDTQLFDFSAMTEQVNGQYFIDGERLKTGTKFFTPILKPAMDVLEKYEFKLPKISNQKANDYLHVIQERLEIRKNLTFHVARHSFATLVLAHGASMEDAAKMLGHQDIKTTQIYGKILRTTIVDHSRKIASTLR